MKKIILLFAAFVLSITLMACNRNISDLEICLKDPTAPECQTACPAGQELVGQNCLEVCPDGEHREGEDCVVDTLECPNGQHEEAGVCVLDDNRTPEEIGIDVLVNGYDGNIAFLSTAMVNMHFENALTMTSELNFEITEDIDEVHYIEATIVDSFVYDDTNGDMIKRNLTLDVDNEITVQFSVILHEVPTGVHIYIEVEPIIAELALENPEAAEILNWVGLEHQWAVIKLDDSLQNVVEIEVLKDMVVALFFSEMGETFFVDLQENMIEPQIGFDLSQYDVNLGVLVDFIIEEDWVNVEAEIMGIQHENILLHADAMYVAPMLREFLLDYELDLEAAGFNFDTLIPLLDVAIYNAIDDVWEPTLPVDPLEGTEAFFRAMTPADIEALTNVVIKPLVSSAIYHNMMQEADPDWLYNDYLTILQQNEQFLIDNWPTESGVYDPTAEYALYANLGPYQYYLQLTDQERGIIQWAVDMNAHGWVVFEFDHYLDKDWDEYRWFLRRYELEIDLGYLEGEMNAFLVQNQTEFETTHSMNVTQMLVDLGNDGIYDWYMGVDYHYREIFVNATKEVGNEGFESTIDTLERMTWGEYGWFYRTNYDFMNPMWMRDALVNLINSHQTYLNDEYGINANQMVLDIDNYGVVEWYMNYATNTEIDALDEISYFGGEDHEGRWVVDSLQRLQEEGYYLWFGRPEEKQDIDWLTIQTEDFIDSFRNDIYGATYNPDLYLQDIYDYGVLEWYQALPQAEIDYLRQLADNNTWHHAHWTMYTLEHIDRNIEEFTYCWGTWQYCNDPDNLTEQLVLLVQSYEHYLLDEYGIIAADLVASIEANGAMYYYFDMANEDQRNILREIAEMNHWQYEVLWAPENILRFEEDVINYLTAHDTYLDGLGIDAAAMVTDIQTNGIQVFMSTTMTVADIELVFADYITPKVTGLHAAILGEEVLEFIFDEFFSDPHIVYVINNEIGVNPVFDHTILAANMMAIDFDQLLIELQGLLQVDFENLALAIYDGQTAYDAHVAAMTQTNLALFLELLSPGVLSAEPYMGYLHDVEYAFDNLSMFDQFIDPTYYIPSIVDLEPSRTPDTELLLEFELDGLAYAEIFNDLTDQVALMGSGMSSMPFPFDENWVCKPEYLPNCESPNFVEVQQFLLTFDPITGHILYDPYDLSWMEIGIDLTAFADGIVSDEYARRLEDIYYIPHADNDDWTGVNELSLVMTMQNASTITLPATQDTADVQVVLDNFAKFNISYEAYRILEEYTMYLPIDPLELDPSMINEEIYLSTIEEMQFSKAFDLEMSYIMVVVPMIPNPVPGQPDLPDFTNMDYEIVLYWIDGTLVHDNPVGYQEMFGFWLDGDLVSEAAYDTMVGMVNDTNWHLMKLFTYYLWQDMNEDMNMK